MDSNVSVVVSIECRGPAFVKKNGDLRLEKGVADVLRDIVDQIRSGVRVADLHGQKVRVFTGQEVASISVSESETPAK